MAEDWSDSQLDELRKLWPEGHSTAEIGRRIGKTKNAVIGKARRLHLPLRAPVVINPKIYTAKEDAIIRDGAARGLGDRQIAKLLGRTFASAQARRNRLDVELREDTIVLLRKKAAVAAGASHKKAAAATPKWLKPVPFVSRVILSCDPIPLTHEHRGCQWLTSDARPWMVCSNSRVAGLSYCAGHYHLSIRSSTPPTEPEEAPVVEMEMAA